MTDPRPPQQPYGHPSAWPQQQPYAPTGLPAPLRRRKSRAGVWIGVVVAAVVVLAGGAVLVSAVTGTGPAASVFKDSGVAACEAMRDSAAAKARASAPPVASQNPADQFKAYQQFRKQFADSRYDDLRTAGTELLDLIYQVSGTSSSANAGLALVAAGQIVQKWGALAGACANHGVELPKLSG